MGSNKSTEFSIFAKALAKSYKREQNQGKYVESLFFHITNNEEKLLKREQRSEKTYTSYYAGTRDITPIAKAIYNDINKTKFIKFLKVIEFNNEEKVKLCQAFKKISPDVKPDNIFEVITDTFVKIIENARNKPDRRSNKSEIEQPITAYEITPMSAENSNVINDTDKIKSLISHLKTTLDSLIRIGQKIANSSKRSLSGTTAMFLKPNNDLNIKFEQLLTLAEAIEDYNHKTKIKMLDKALELIEQITKESFIESEAEFMITSCKNQYIHELLSVIDMINAEIEPNE